MIRDSSMKRLDELGRQTRDLAKMAIDMDMDALDVVDWNADIQEILKAYKELCKRLDALETEKRNRDAVIIYQLIDDIQNNAWYCIQGGSESELEYLEKNLIIIGLRKLLED